MKTIVYKWNNKGLQATDDAKFLCWLRLSVTKKEARLKYGNSVLEISQRLPVDSNELLLAFDDLNFPNQDTDFGPHALLDGYSSEIQADKIRLKNLEMNPKFEKRFLDTLTDFLKFNIFDKAREHLKCCACPIKDFH